MKNNFTYFVKSARCENGFLPLMPCQTRLQHQKNKRKRLVKQLSIAT